jgi:hypothetical protein
MLSFNCVVQSYIFISVKYLFLVIYRYENMNVNPSNLNMALGSTQPLTEMSTRNLPGGKGRPTRKADNLTVICEPII